MILIIESELILILVFVASPLRVARYWILRLRRHAIFLTRSRARVTWLTVAVHTRFHDHLLTPTMPICTVTEITNTLWESIVFDFWFAPVELTLVFDTSPFGLMILA